LLAVIEGNVAHCAAYHRFLNDFLDEVQPMHKVSDSVRSTHSQDGAIVLDVQQGHMFNLNLVGSRILELLESGSSAEQVAEVVAREFNGDIEMVKRDLVEFLEVLETYKLVDTRSA
jgi:hypothetical protein